MGSSMSSNEKDDVWKTDETTGPGEKEKKKRKRKRKKIKNLEGQEVGHVGESMAKKVNLFVVAQHLPNPITHPFAPH